MDIENRVVVITGGGSGIGEALARASVVAGAAHVVVAMVRSAYSSPTPAT